MPSVRRFLAVFAFALWQGGFLFYSAVVVPVGSDVLGSPAEQGVVTRRVTHWLNLIGVAALTATAWEQARTRDPDPRRMHARWWTWAVLFACQYLLFFLHMLLDAFMSPDGRQVVIGPPFRPVHRMYLWTSTIQWAAALVLMWLMLRAWRAEDCVRNGGYNLR